MWSYVLRRLLIAVLVIFAASYLVYVLSANAGDPLETLRGSTAPNKEQLMAALSARLNLDVPPFLRYFIWLGGIFRGDFGLTLSGLPVGTLLAQSAWSTIQLVTTATVLAMFFGISIGMVSALRQYSGFDYSVTFIAFLFFALPTFWVGQMLKLNVAIAFNDFLDNPYFTPIVIVLLSLAGGFIWASAMGGQLKRFSLNFALGAVTVAVILVYTNVTDFFQYPNLGPLWVGIIGIGAAFAVTQLTTGISNRRALYSALSVAVVGVVLWWPVQYAFFYWPTWGAVLVLGIVALGVGALIGWLWGGDDRAVSIRTAMIVAFVSGLTTLIDRIMGAWPDYVANTGGRPIATIGSQSPNLDGSIWLGAVDTFSHLLLPTLTIMLISLASYSRYSRGSLLEVMNMDYVRTARAKGLNERTVVMRHAFRNALIPLATIVAFDLGGLIGGAVITENVFAWKGMGAMFVDALHRVDVNAIMGVFLVTSVLALLFNLLADLTYSVLDPRIRVS